MIPNHWRCGQVFGTRILLESSGCFWSFPAMRPSISLGTGDACGLAAWLSRVVSGVQLALASESEPGPGARAEL